jgi:ADP-ribose pyrophosphatase YjhB (NUDIX family)
MSSAPPFKSDDYNAYLAEGNARQARKRVAADLLIRNRGSILLVDPVYKPDWDLPGGMIEANESPYDGVRRELREELHLAVTVGSLLCVDWVAPHGPWDDLLAFIFDGGELSDHEAAALKPHDQELAHCQFFSPDQVCDRLRPYVYKRLQHALAALRDGRTRYLHYGEPPSPTHPA